MKNNFKKIVSGIFLAILLILPNISFAATTTAVSPTRCFDAYKKNEKLGGLFNYATCTIVDSIIPLIFALAFVLFIWGVVQFVINSEEEAKKEKGRQYMIWGIIGLTVMFSIWGLVNVLGNTFNINTSVAPKLPVPF